MLTDTCWGVPASDCAVVRSWVDFVWVSCFDYIDSISVTYMKIEELSLRHLKATDKPVLITCVYFLLVEAKRANIFVLFDLPQCFLSVKNVIFCVIEHLIICKTKQIFIRRTMKFSFCYSFLLKQIPYDDHWITWSRNKQTSFNSFWRMKWQNCITVSF